MSRLKRQRFVFIHSFRLCYILRFFRRTLVYRFAVILNLSRGKYTVLKGCTTVVHHRVVEFCIFEMNRRTSFNYDFRPFLIRSPFFQKIYIFNFYANSRFKGYKSLCAVGYKSLCRLVSPILTFPTYVIWRYVDITSIVRICLHYYFLLTLFSRFLNENIQSVLIVYSIHESIFVFCEHPGIATNESDCHKYS